MAAAPNMYERMAALSLELRGIPDVEPSNITTKFEPPHSIDLLHYDGSVSEYTATWQGRTITAEFETSWDDVRGDMHVSVGVMAPSATDVELDMLEAWWLEWHEKQGEEL